MSRPYKTPFYFYYCVPRKIPRDILFQIHVEYSPSSRLLSLCALQFTPPRWGLCFPSCQPEIHGLIPTLIGTVILLQIQKRQESSKHNYYIISPRVIIKAIIIMHLKNATTSKSTKSRNSNSSDQFKLQFVLWDTEEFEFLDLANFWGVVFSVETAIVLVQFRNILKIRAS